MGKALRRLAARICVTVAVIVVAYGGWKWGDGLFPREALGRAEVSGLPASAILVPEVAGLGTAFIRDGTLVLVRA